MRSDFKAAGTGQDLEAVNKSDSALSSPCSSRTRRPHSLGSRLTLEQDRCLRTTHRAVRAGLLGEIYS